MNASDKKGDESKVRMKQTSREEAKENENLAKRIIIGGIATERNEGQQENLQKFQDGRAVEAVPCLRRSSHCQRLRFPEENDVSSTIAVPQRVVSIQSVDGAKGMFIEMFEDHREQIDEYETDSDEEESDFKEHSELVNRACVT